MPAGSEDYAQVAEEALALGKEDLIRLLVLIRHQTPVYEALLGKAISADFDDLPLGGATAFVTEQTGLKVVTSLALKAERFANLRFSLHLVNVAADTYLALLTHSNGLAWEPRDGGVWIGTAEEISGH